MNGNVLRKDFLKDKEKWLWEWPFEEKGLLNDPKFIRPISQRNLINKLNHTHFMGSPLHIFFQDIHNQKKILLQAKIKSCTETTIKCICLDKAFVSINTHKYQMTHIAIDDGKNLILMPAFLLSKKNNFFTINLPDEGYEVNQRQVRRTICHNVNVDLTQDNRKYNGILLDFSSFDCRIQLKPAAEFHFNKDFPINISFYRDKESLYSCTCYFIRENKHPLIKEIVLKFIRIPNSIPTKQKKLRNPRLNLVPAPFINFEHPILKKKLQLEVDNISASGFRVYENCDESILLEGLILPKLTINFTDSFKIKCSAKVIYCIEEKENKIRCGLSILDMDIKSYNELNRILARAIDSHVYTNNEINMESLWELFFNSNFIYPQKYKHIQFFKEDLQRTYQRLYNDNLEIANHFTYQKNGIIYGHMSMLRAYERTWLVHHHTAKIIDNKPIGFFLLEQLIAYLFEMHHLPSLKTDYMLFYYRPENKFPAKVFGGFYQAESNHKACSMDLTAYLEYHNLVLCKQLPKGWHIRPSSAKDIQSFHCFYKNNSGGMLLDAIGLSQNNFNAEPIEEMYHQLGFFRRLRFYSLTFDEELYAVLLVDQSDPCLNLSDLVNSIKVFIIKPEGLPWNALSIALDKLIQKYRMERIPILIYPFDYVKINNLNFQKQYQALVFNAAYLDQIAEFLQNTFRVTYWN